MSGKPSTKKKPEPPKARLHDELRDPYPRWRRNHDPMRAPAIVDTLWDPDEEQRTKQKGRR